MKLKHNLLLLLYEILGIIFLSLSVSSFMILFTVFHDVEFSVYSIGIISFVAGVMCVIFGRFAND